MKLAYDLKDVFCLHENCVVTQGQKRALIHNLSRHKFDLIPLEMIEVIELLDKDGINATMQFYGEDNRELITQYIQFLIQNGYGRVCCKDDFLYKNRVAKATFKKWAAPAAITNAIIDYSPANDQYQEEILKQLGSLGCQSIQLRFFFKTDFFLINRILTLAVSQESFYGISLVLDGEELNGRNENVTELTERFPILNEIIIYNAGRTEFQRNTNRQVNILFIEGTLSTKSCGAIQPFYFNATNSHYAESLQHNTCLNRKISIDDNGNIKNCPNMDENFGCITTVSLKTVIDNPEFQKYWAITKDHVTKCKNCEFRHVCTDCRAFLDTPGDNYSAPLKCGYNPDTCEWEDWSANPLKQAAIGYYGMGGERVENRNTSA